MGAFVCPALLRVSLSRGHCIMVENYFFSIVASDQRRSIKHYLQLVTGEITANILTLWLEYVDTVSLDTAYTLISGARVV